jgi:hypothetical protein
MLILDISCFAKKNAAAVTRARRFLRQAEAR